MMKKRCIALLTVLCLMLTLAPAALAAEPTMDETAFRNAVASGGTVTMTGNVTLTSPLEISNAVVIDGTSAKYSITGPSGKNAINVSVAGVELKNLTLITTGGGYAVDSTGSSLTVTDCTISAAARGISFYPTSGAGATLTVTGTTIQNPNIEDYDSNAQAGDYRGIATRDIKGGNVTITNCQILGYGYSINALVQNETSGLRDGQGTSFNITNTTIKGWTALNMWSANTKFNFTNCTLVGINTLSGSSNGFSTIRANDGIYGGHTDKESVVTIKGGSVISKQYGSALETPFTVDRELQTKFAFVKNGRTKVSIQCYTTGTEAYVFNFYPGVDGDGYLASSKVEGYSSNATVSAGSLLSLNTLPAFISEGNEGGQDTPIAFEEIWTGGDAE